LVTSYNYLIKITSIKHDQFIFVEMNFMNKQGFKIILIIVFAFVAVNMNAQSDSLDVLVKRYQLNYENLKSNDSFSQMEIISASRSSKKLEDLPLTAYIITHEDIVNNGYVTLVDVLKSLPAVRTSQPGSGESGEMFLLRGLLGNSYTKILINDIPIQPSVLGGIPIGAQLPIKQAERIEIIYGTASSIYGADATNGVINIITNSPNKNNFANADVTMGNNGYSTMSFMVGGKAGKDKGIIEYNIYGSKTDVKNLNILHTDVFNPTNTLHYQYDTLPFFNVALNDISSDFLIENGISEDSILYYFFPENYDGDLYNPEMSSIPQSSHLFGIQLGYKGFSFSYDNMYRRDHSSLGYSTYLYKYNNSMNYIGETIQRINLSFNKDFRKFSTSTKLTYLKYTMDENSSYGLTYVSDVRNWYVYSASDDILFDQVLNFTLFNKVELLSGVSYQYSGNLPITNGNYKPFDVDEYTIFQESSITADTTFGSFGLNPITFNNLASYIQAYFDLNNFSVMAGLRFDKNSIYGASINPRISILYKISQGSILRASTGTSYKAPSPNTMYYSIAVPSYHGDESISYEFIPNKNLEPEKFKSHEIGFRQFFSKNIYLDLAAYYNQISNLITPTAVYIDTLPNRPLSRMNVNVSNANAKVYGIQTSLIAKNIIPEIMLNTELNLNVSSGEEVLPNNDKISAYRNNPAFIGQLNFDFTPVPKFIVKIDNVFMSNWYRKYIPNAEFFKRKEITKIDGYATMDLMFNYKLSSQFQFYIKVLNVFDKEYGGIDVSGSDIDLIYNPQLKRSFRFGLVYGYN
jgi:outer membrane cobalamin receptor